MAIHNPPHPGEFIRATYLEPFELTLLSPGVRFPDPK